MMRVLFLAPQEWYPPDSGGRLRNYFLAKALARCAHVTWLGFSDEGTPDGVPPARFSSVPEIEPPAQRLVYVRRQRGYTPRKLSAGALGKVPLPVLNYRSAAMSRELALLLADESFDIVHIAALPLADYLPVIRSSGQRIVVSCDWHNVDSILMSRYSENAPGLVHRVYAARTAKLLRSFERRVLTQCDAHTTVSERDRSHLLCVAPDAPIYTIENGVDVAYLGAGNGSNYRKRDEIRRARVLFVGSMDYPPNEFAVLEFATRIWPAVLRRHPELIFTIVGRNPSAAVRALARRSGIEVTGTVPDVRPYYLQALLAVTPLRVGGGSRIKILEAMASGVPVLSTPIGAEGLQLRYGEHIVVAESGSSFLEDLLTLIGRPDTRAKISRAALVLVRDRYDWSSIGSKLVEIYRNLLDKARPCRAVLAGCPHEQDSEMNNASYLGTAARTFR